MMMMMNSCQWFKRRMQSSSPASLIKDSTGQLALCHRSEGSIESNRWPFRCPFRYVTKNTKKLTVPAAAAAATAATVRCLLTRSILRGRHRIYDRFEPRMIYWRKSWMCLNFPPTRDYLEGGGGGILVCPFSIPEITTPVPRATALMTLSSSLRRVEIEDTRA